MTTSKEVLSWLEANIGKAVEFNNGSDVQCVDLVNAMSQKFFGKAMFVGIDYAAQIWDLTFPAGWKKIPAAQGAKPGDVFVMSAEQAGNEVAGHTGIIAEDGVQVYDENYAGRKYVSKHEISGGYIGFIRPPYDNRPTPEEEEEMMHTLLVYNNSIYLMIGQEIKQITTSEAVELVKRIYKAQFGKDINAFSLTNKEAEGLGIK